MVDEISLSYLRFLSSKSDSCACVMDASSEFHCFIMGTYSSAVIALKLEIRVLQITRIGIYGDALKVHGSALGSDRESIISIMGFVLY